MQRGDDYLLSHLPPPSRPLPDTWRGSTYGGRARRGRVFIRHTQNTSCQKACVHDRGVSRELWCSGATLHLFIFFGHGESDLIGRTREDEMSVAASVWTEKKICCMMVKEKGFLSCKVCLWHFPFDPHSHAHVQQICLVLPNRTSTFEPHMRKNKPCYEERFVPASSSASAVILKEVTTVKKTHLFVHLDHFIRNKNGKQCCSVLNWQNRT